jgi:hypothetical protein
MADEFFARFAERVAPPAVAAAAAPATAKNAARAAPIGNRAMRYIALALLAVLVGWLATRGFRF